MGGWSRREALAAGAASIAVMALGGVATAAAGAKPAMTTYRDPGCGCCGAWADLAKEAGFPVTVVPTSDMMALKERLGVPEALASCHTSKVAGYVVEGHVTFAAVDKLVRTKPAGIVGIAVPGMPAGSPGMEAHGDQHAHGHGAHEALKVFAFDRSGRQTAFSYQG